MLALAAHGLAWPCCTVYFVESAPQVTGDSAGEGRGRDQRSSMAERAAAGVGVGRGQVVLSVAAGVAGEPHTDSGGGVCGD